MPTTFGFGQSIRAMLWTFIVLAMLEAGGLELIFDNAAVRGMGIVVHLAILVLAVRLLRRSSRSFGHELTEEALIVRGLLRGEAVIPRAAILSTSTGTAAVFGKPRIIDGVLQLPISSSTNVELVLSGPLEVDVTPHARGQITKVRIWADDAQGLAAALAA